MNQARQDVEVAGSSNQDFIGASQLEIRLDTRKQLVKDIEFFLRGKEENFYFDPETQTVKPLLKNMGIPKANHLGIQGILNFCRSLINTQVVQGNYDMDRYLMFISEKRTELIKILIGNFYEWEIPSDGTIQEICDFVMNIVEPFLSRTIGNKEREGFNAAVKSVETNKINTGGLNLFGLGGK